MSEPILSRDQIYEEMTKRDPYWNAYGASRGVAVDLAIKCALAVLERIFGEPIYQAGDGNELWRDVEKDEFDLTHHARIVYALTRSKP
ncbi:hypothetical protein KDX40_04700 [Burkholderia ambifaria]|uniref:hypothetical protein n=1 Tax=Burkholderia ambifaria TaxID=152480 RepID=UPI001B9BAACE|nr:hypothetical protein [Burkholderia ambifaria]MBR8343037.1 hypothetical protein [Burkholderia ambifaria]